MEDDKEEGGEEDGVVAERAVVVVVAVDVQEEVGDGVDECSSSGEEDDGSGA
jgi:hypothetical protein